MVYEFFIGIVAIAGLIFGAELVIHNARHIAHRLRISDFFIGLTIFSIGTSFPEIATHVIASIDILRGVDMATMSGLAVGTNVGSNIIQISLITGIVAFFGTLKANKKFLRVDYVVMLISILLLFVFALDGVVSRVEGFALIVVYGAYLFNLIKSERLKKKIIKEAKDNHGKSHLYLEIIAVITGLIILLLSADRIAELAVVFSERYLIAGSLLGTLVIGVSTALPEFTTSVFALMKKNSGMSLGTLVGSNITNPLLALGIGALISTYVVENSILWFDIPFWFVLSLIPLALMWRKNLLTRGGGILLMVGYVVFVVVRLRVF